MRLSTILRMNKRKTVEGIPSTEAVAGDVCMYGISEGKLIIVNDWDASKYPIDKYPPIGVVVVPGSHGHYEGGKCAIMSLNHMNCDTPKQGGLKQRMYWGELIDLPMPNLNVVPYTGKDGNGGNTVIGWQIDSCLPSDHNDFTAIINPYDSKTNYKYYFGYYSPSPYNNDGTFNSNYSLITQPSSTANCLSDFNGYGNTKLIITQRGNKDYSSWKPTYNNLSDYPAASCCDMYSTAGTKQGDWYLPAAGELGYAVVRQKTINDTITKLIQSGVNNADIFDLSYYYTSTEHSHLNVRLLDFFSGTVDWPTKENKLYVRSFLQV